MAQIFTNFTINATNFVMNADTGAYVPAISGSLSDVQVVANLCADYQWYIIFEMAAVLLLMFMKAYFYRLTKDKRAKPWVKRMYRSVDNIIDGVVTIFCVIQLILAWIYLF